MNSWSKGSCCQPGPCCSAATSSPPRNCLQNEAISNQELANQLGVSEAYFCRFFKRSMQMTPIEYIQRCRIKEAAAKLQQHPEQPIIEIAFGCGFNNLSYFNLIFKRLIGCTPTIYKSRSAK